LGCRVWVSIPCRRGVCSFLQNIQTSSGVHPASYSIDTKSSFPRGKVARWPENEGDHSPRLRMTAATALLSLYTFTPVTGAALCFTYCACNMQWNLKARDTVVLFVDHAKNEIFIMIS